MRTRPWEVDDAFWERVRPLIPPIPPGQRPGRPRVDDRRIFGAIVFVLRTGAQWKAIPRAWCSSSTAHRRFQEWEQAGFLALLLFPWVHGRPGRGGQSPPKVSLASAMRASVEWNPKARRMTSRSLPLRLSTRALVIR